MDQDTMSADRLHSEHDHLNRALETTPLTDMPMYIGGIPTRLQPRRRAIGINGL